MQFDTCRLTVCTCRIVTIIKIVDPLGIPQSFPALPCKPCRSLLPSPLFAHLSPTLQATTDLLSNYALVCTLSSVMHLRLLSFG